MSERDMERTGALLERAGQGDSQAQAQVLAGVRAELERAVGARLRATGGLSLPEPSALIHEAWLRLFGGNDLAHGQRDAFLRVAAKAMRSLLVERARATAPRRQMEAGVSTGLDGMVERLEAGNTDLQVLDEALVELEGEDVELGLAVELLFFGGLTPSDVSRIQGIAPPMVPRLWRLGRARLHRRMGRSEVRSAGVE